VRGHVIDAATPSGARFLATSGLPINAARQASWRDVLRADLCAYCYERAATVDHIVASARQGENAWTNVTGSCVDCNQRKGDQKLLEFLLRQALWNDNVVEIPTRPRRGLQADQITLLEAFKCLLLEAS
jgi:5-methylcytosine-specific restriction endonuclease McrA